MFLLMTIGLSVKADDVPSWTDGGNGCRVGVEVDPAFVAGTDGFLRGENQQNKDIRSNLSFALKGGFSFNKNSREGILYPGTYQGIGIGASTFFSKSLLGTPVSAFVYQGSPIVHFSRNVWLGYEWQFGAAFGWKHYDKESFPENLAVGSSVTAHMGVGFKIHWNVSDRMELNAGIEARHFSNGNTSWPNGGVNTLGASFGISYLLNPTNGKGFENISPDQKAELKKEADKGAWLFDLVGYGAWRKRGVIVGGSGQMCPGKFGVAGIQFAPMRKFNRWVAAGVSLDMQYDESAGIADYWVKDTHDDNIKFTRPPFGKQVSIGLSAHAELTMPIFALNIGLGYNLLNPEGDKRFYQSLTLKTFVTKHLFLNVGYRLGHFETPQNLMLGVGYRF